jgi:hypothetical protein
LLGWHVCRNHRSRRCPDINEAQTAHANSVLQEGRDRVAELGKERDLTLDDCHAIPAEVEARLVRT